MILSNVALPVPYAQCKDLAIVYPYDVAVTWYSIQQQHGDLRHVADGRQLSDGRWMLNGDLLSELHANGILAWALPYLTLEITSQIEVVPLADVMPLIPEVPFIA